MIVVISMYPCEWFFYVQFQFPFNCPEEQYESQSQPIVTAFKTTKTRLGITVIQKQHYSSYDS